MLLPKPPLPPQPNLNLDLIRQFSMMVLPLYILQLYPKCRDLWLVSNFLTKNRFPEGLGNSSIETIDKSKFSTHRNVQEVENSRNRQPQPSTRIHELCINIFSFLERILKPALCFHHQPVPKIHLALCDILQNNQWPTLFDQQPHYILQLFHNQI